MAAPLFSWLRERSAGVLLHPTALPGPQGIGSLGTGAREFIDFLAAGGFRFWQICPLGPTGFGDSPYQSFSSFAGNPYLVDLPSLVRQKWLPKDLLATLSDLPTDHVGFGDIFQRFRPLLHVIHKNWVKAGRPDDAGYGSYKDFCRQQERWLPAYTAFMAIKDSYGGKPWPEWPDSLLSWPKAQQNSQLSKFAEAREVYSFSQYLFFGQWQEVRSYAKSRGIEIIGDLPIFVAWDSADVWTDPSPFQLDQSGRQPRAVAGVPPDYFSEDGQLWGNPLYDWPELGKDGYAWWMHRLEASFQLYDVVRLDHFRGFASYWSVPVGAESAREGQWVEGPGLAFFKTVRRRFPKARIIAEDLGELTPDVFELMRETGLPGMAVLQFAFSGDPENLYLPYNLSRNSVIYPGTHDNNTTTGWYAEAEERTRDQVRRYFRVNGEEIGWDFARAALASPSRLAIIPLQDLLSLGSEARFNTPGESQGNWQWRFHRPDLMRLHYESSGYLKELNQLYGRWSPSPAAPEI